MRLLVEKGVCAAARCTYHARSRKGVDRTVMHMSYYWGAPVRFALKHVKSVSHRDQQLLAADRLKSTQYD